MQVAHTEQEQETGLREEHSRGNTQASMAFPDVQPGQSFNTVGMKAPINIQKIDNQGHLVESYENVPPGIQDLPTGPYEGTIIESPAAYQKGGVKFSFQDGGFNFDPIASTQDQIVNQTQQIQITQDAQEFQVQQEKDLEELSDWDFKGKYGTSKHAVKMSINPETDRSHSFKKDWGLIKMLGETSVLEGSIELPNINPLVKKALRVLEGWLEKTDIDKKISNYRDEDGKKITLTPQQQLDNFGITSEQSYNPNPIQQLLHNNLFPRGYETTGSDDALQYSNLEELKDKAKIKIDEAQKSGDTDGVKDWTSRLENYNKGRTAIQRVVDVVYHNISEFETQGKELYGPYFNSLVQKSRIDAYNIYMGKPMYKRDKNGRWEGDPEYDEKSGNYKNVSIASSMFKPTDQDSPYNEYYIDKKVSNNLKANNGVTAKKVIEFLQDNGGTMAMQSANHSKTSKNKKYTNLRNTLGANRTYGLHSGFMGGYTLKLDEDKDGNKFLVYQDVFDIEPLGKKVDKIYDIEIGQPFNVYDRVYYKTNKNGNITIIDPPKPKKEEKKKEVKSNKP